MKLFLLQLKSATKERSTKGTNLVPFTKNMGKKETWKIVREELKIYQTFPTPENLRAIEAISEVLEDSVRYQYVIKRILQSYGYNARQKVRKQIAQYEKDFQEWSKTLNNGVTFEGNKKRNEYINNRRKKND